MFCIPSVPRQKQLCSACCMGMALLFVLSGGGVPANAALDAEPLRLTLNPPSTVNSEDCGHDPPPAATSSRPGRPSGSTDQPGRPGAASGQPGRPSGPVQESEHRPVPKRTYHLTKIRSLADVQAFVQRPDGSTIEPELHLGVSPGLSFPTPMGDGPVHGANNVYVIEQSVEKGILIVRTAKWITMHHNCGWGHELKFDKTRITPQSLGTIPFEIVINNLWDTNFHASVTSGDQLEITALSHEKPVPGATITLSTEKGWTKQVVTDEQGKASLQLIRDYYPTSWPLFQRTHRGKFLVTAQYDVDQPGKYQDKPYKRIRYISTLPWKYSPSRRDYSSYTFGLLIGTLALTVSGVGVYAYRERRKKPYQRISFDE